VCSRGKDIEYPSIPNTPIEEHTVPDMIFDRRSHLWWRDMLWKTIRKLLENIQIDAWAHQTISI